MADSLSLLASSGGDYTSAQSWLNAKKGVTGTHTLEVANEPLTGTAILNDAATAATAFIIMPASGAEHDGRSRDVSGTGAQLVGATASEPVIWWFQSNGKRLTVQGVNLKQSSTGHVIYALNSSPVSVIRNVLQGVGGGSYRLIDAQTAGPHYVHDNIGYGAGWGVDARSSTAEIVGNTFHCTGGSGNYGCLPGTTALKVRNNIVVGYAATGGQDFFDSDVGDTNHGNNIASDATADTEWNGAGGSYNSLAVYETGDTPTGHYVAFTSIGTGTEDYSLVDLAHGTYVNRAIGGGAPGHGSGYDAADTARDGSAPAIGAREVAGAGADRTITAASMFGQALASAAAKVAAKLIASRTLGALTAAAESKAIAKATANRTLATLTSVATALAGAARFAAAAGVLASAQSSALARLLVKASATRILASLIGHATVSGGAIRHAMASIALPALTGQAFAETSTATVWTPVALAYLPGAAWDAGESVWDGDDDADDSVETVWDPRSPFGGLATPGSGAWSVPSPLGSSWRNRLR